MGLFEKFFSGKSEAIEKTRHDLFPNEDDDEEEREREEREKAEKEKLEREQEEAIRVANAKKESKKSDGGGFFGSGW